MADVMRADPAKYGGDAACAAQLDGLMVALERGLLTGGTFRACLDQPFDILGAIDASMTTKELLKTRALENIEYLLGTVGSELETTEALQIVGQMAIYGLYRSLTARIMPDPKVYEKLWRVTERVLLVPLWSKHAFLPDVFLREYCAIPGIVASKLVPRVSDGDGEGA